MRTVVVSPNERRPVKRALVDYVEVEQPFDFLIFTKRGEIPIERKTVGDMLASAQDGRFARECAAMRETSKFPHIIIEGRYRFSPMGFLISGIETNWSRRAIRNLERSMMFVEGCIVEHTRSIIDTANRIQEIGDYFDSISHDSLRCRASISTDWPSPVYQERYRYWLEGLPEVKAGRADKIMERFTCPASVMAASAGDLMKVSGIGKYMAELIWKFLHEER